MKINFKKLSKKQVITIVICAILAIVIIPSGIYCGINGETPIQMAEDIFTSNEKQIVAKWQGDNAATAYEFYEDGTYDSYISTFSFTGQYQINGSELKLMNPNSSNYVLYRFSINGDTLNLTLLEESGVEPKEKEKTVYKKVDHFNMKSFTDILEEYANEVNEEETTEAAK